MQWVEYNNSTKRTLYNSLPMSDITAEAVSVDAFVLSQTDNAGVTTTSPSPLAIQKDGTWYTYGWDLTKNICELYGTNGDIRTAYTYSPYGSVTESGNTRQPIQWSSEYNDTELGLVYYNYRHYNPLDGRWLGRDRISSLLYLLYSAYKNNPVIFVDLKGDYIIPILVLLGALLGTTSCSEQEEKKDLLNHLKILKLKHCKGLALPLPEGAISNIEEIKLDILQAIHMTVADEIDKIIMKSVIKWVKNYSNINSKIGVFHGYLIVACICPENDSIKEIDVIEFSDMAFEYAKLCKEENGDFYNYSTNYLNEIERRFEARCESLIC